MTDVIYHVYLDMGVFSRIVFFNSFQAMEESLFALGLDIVEVNNESEFYRATYYEENRIMTEYDNYAVVVAIPIHNNFVDLLNNPSGETYES